MLSKPTAISSAAILLVVSVSACSSRPSTPSEAITRQALEAALPNIVVIDQIEMEAIPKEPHHAVVRFRGTASAREALFSAFEGDPVTVYPQIGLMRDRLAKRDTIGALSSFIIRDSQKPLSEQEMEFAKIVTGLKKLARSFITKKADAKQKFPVSGTVEAHQEFQEWKFSKWSGLESVKELGTRRQDFPADALEIQSPAAESAIQDLVARVEGYADKLETEEEDQRTAAIAAKKRAVEPILQRLRGLTFEGTVSEPFRKPLPVRIAFAAREQWIVDPDRTTLDDDLQVAALDASIDVQDETKATRKVRAFLNPANKETLPEMRFQMDGQRGSPFTNYPWIVNNCVINCQLREQSIAVSNQLTDSHTGTFSPAAK